MSNGFERCVWCGVVFGAEDKNNSKGVDGIPAIGGGVNYTHGPVKNSEGAEYEYVGDSPPGSYLMHPDCYKEYHAEKAAEENKSLDNYA